MPPEAAREGLARAGMPNWLVEHRGDFDQTNDTVRVLTGRDGRTCAEFAREFAAAA